MRLRHVELFVEDPERARRFWTETVGAELEAVQPGGFTWLVLGPYLETQAAWGVLEGRQRMLVWPWQYLPGGTASLGWVLFLLTLISLLDRLRGPRVRVEGIEIVEFLDRAQMALGMVMQVAVKPRGAGLGGPDPVKQ